VSKKQKKAKEVVPEIPKKKKPKKKLYFGPEVQDAIVRYNALDRDENQAERNKIYGEEIHKAFDKLCENIINTFKFEYFDDVYIDVKHAVVAFLVMNMHKYDHTKGSKAFSYFSVVAKNYLILHNNTNYSRYKKTIDITKIDIKGKTYDSDTDEFFESLIRYFDKQIPSIFKKKKDIDIAYAIVELMKRRHEIENFNKKSLYILIREMTNVETVHITRVTNVMKKYYLKMLNEFYKIGYVKLNTRSFFS